MNSFNLLSDLSKDLEKLASQAIFRLFPQTLKAAAETVTIGGFTLPKVGYQTVSESAALSDFVNNHVSNGEGLIWDSVYYAYTATILLKSRYQADWRVEDSLDLPMPVLRSLHEFFMSERMPESEQGSEQEKKDP